MRTAPRRLSYSAVFGSIIVRYVVTPAAAWLTSLGLMVIIIVIIGGGRADDGSRICIRAE